MSTTPPMADFGSNPPRALEAFGVAGLLGERARVFYCSLFSTRHVGRISDLIAARLESEGLDDLRLRALLLFGSFEVFRAHTGSGEEASRHQLSEPLVVECGVDVDKIAIGVSFVAGPGRFPDLDGLVERISAGQSKGPFEALLAQIHAHSDRTVVRAQADARRVEIVALLGIPGKMSEDARSAREPVALVRIGAAEVQQPPAVEEYVELGDLDYPELLRENAPGAAAARPASGEVLVHGCTELEEAFKVRAEKLLEDLTGRRISGTTARLNDDLIRVSGAPQAERDETVFKVSEGSAIRTKGGALRANPSARAAPAVAPDGAVPAPSAPDEATGARSEDRAKSDAPRAEAEELETSPEAGEADRGGPEGESPEDQTQGGDVGEEAEEEEEEGEEEETGGAIQAVIEKVKNAWPFRWGRRKGDGVEAESESAPEEGESDDEDGDSGTEDEESPEDEGQAEEEEEAGEGDEAGAGEEEDEERDKTGTNTKKKLGRAKSKGKKSKRPLAPSAGNDETDSTDGEDGEDVESAIESAAAMAETNSQKVTEASAELDSEIETGMDRTIKKALQEAVEIKKEMESPKAKRWVDGLMSELVAEKVRLADAAKKLNLSIRHTELEFRNKEQLLREELRRRDDQIKQKNNALTRAKEQLSQATMSAERAKSQKAGAADEAHYKQKYTMAQKMLNATKEENTALSDKIEELKNQVANAQLSGNKRNQVSMSDFAAIQSKYERALRQADELKKTNQQLTDKLAEAKKDRVQASGQDELKKRLESSQKMVANHQKEAERLYQKVEDMQREQMRLQGELNRANNELKSVKLAKGKVGGGAPPPAGAAPAAASSAPPAAPGAGGAAAAPATPAQGTPPKAA